MKSNTKEIFLIGLLTLSALCPMAFAEEDAAAVRRCERCRRIIGAEVPESDLSRDPDFRKHGMFQKCRACLNSVMGKRAQARYYSVAQKYKWSSIRHNRRMISLREGRVSREAAKERRR